MEGVFAYQGQEFVQSPDATRGFDGEKKNQNPQRHAKGIDEDGSGRIKHTIKDKRLPLLIR